MDLTPDLGSYVEVDGRPAVRFERIQFDALFVMVTALERPQARDAGCDDLMACAASAACPLPFPDLGDVGGLRAPAE